MRRALILTIAACAALVVPLGVLAAKPKRRGLTLAANPGAVTYHRSSLLSGRLRGPDHAGKTILLQRKPYPYRGFRDVRTTKTDSGGKYSFRVRPRVHTLYRTGTIISTPYEKQLLSPQIIVHVRLRVRIHLSTTRPRRGHRVRFYGTAAPRHNGRRVLIQRRRPSGRWGTIARTRTRPMLGNRSRYSRRVRIGRTGFYRVRVRSGDRDHSRGTSRVRFIRVR